MKKKIKMIGLTAILGISVFYLSYSVSIVKAEEVSVTATVNPISAFLLNFDAFNITAFKGIANNPVSNYTDSGTPQSDPGYQIIQSLGSSFSVYISGTDFTNSDSSLTLNAERLKVTVEDEDGVKIKTYAVPDIDPTIESGIQIDTGTSDVNRDISFVLDLSDSNMYDENSVLNSITGETTFTSTLTFQYTEAY